MLMEMKIKKCVLLEDDVSDWLYTWMTSAMVEVQGKTAIRKKFFFSLTGWFSQILSHIGIVSPK